MTVRRLTAVVAGLVALLAVPAGVSALPGEPTPVTANPAATERVAEAPSSARASTHGASASSTARAAAATVVVVGDVACPAEDPTTSTQCRQAATARLARKVGPTRVIAAGDLQYPQGSLADFQASYDASWGKLKGRTRAVPGNHEYLTPGAQGFYDYFGLDAPGYRTMNVGGWRVYLLNSQCDEIDCEAQRTWLRDDLNANPVACSAIVMHFPRYSSGPHGSNTSVKPLWKIAYRHGVDLALAGHDHDYERFAAMDHAGRRTTEGIRSFVVGTGGKSLYPRATTAQGSKYFRADKFGVLVLTLTDGDYSWKFKAVGGAVRDRGSASCH